MNQQVRLELPSSMAEAIDKAVAEGAEVILMRDGVAVAKAEALPVIAGSEATAVAVERLLSRRGSMPTVTTGEILDWISEGRR